MIAPAAPRRIRSALLGLALALPAACSDPQPAAAPPTPDERRALAEARAMIPAAEQPQPAATPATRERATP